MLAPLPATPPTSAWATHPPISPSMHLWAFGNESMYRLRPEYLYAGPLASLFTDSFSDTTPLRETLQKVVDLDRLNRYCQVAVTAVNVATGQTREFRQPSRASTRR